MVLWIWFYSFAVLVAGAAVVSLVLTAEVNDTIRNFGLHTAALEAGINLLPTDDFSSQALVEEIAGLQPIT